jgi:hypothetical protein
MKMICASLSAALAFAFCSTAQAVPVPYANPGTPNTQTYVFTAQATGDVMAYFAGSNASYENEITLLVNGVATGVSGLNNHASAYGAQLNLGSVNMGDVLTFELVNLNPGNVGPWYSNASMNSDGRQHIYASAYAGDSLIPAGTAIGFEDLRVGSDFDYNDENFVFTNLATATTDTSDVPEPASLGLMLIGAAGLVLRRRARHAK